MENAGAGLGLVRFLLWDRDPACWCSVFWDVFVTRARCLPWELVLFLLLQLPSGPATSPCCFTPGLGLHEGNERFQVAPTSVSWGLGMGFSWGSNWKDAPPWKIRWAGGHAAFSSAMGQG